MRREYQKMTPGEAIRELRRLNLPATSRANTAINVLETALTSMCGHTIQEVVDSHDPKKAGDQNEFLYCTGWQEAIKELEDCGLLVWEENEEVTV